MSADVWLEPNPDDWCCGPEDPPFPRRSSASWHNHSVNLTYNLSPMLRAAGFPGWKELVGASCVEAGGMLRKVAQVLAADPERFKAMNPANGWGTYEQAIDIMNALATMCDNHPDCKFDGWL